MFIKTRAIDIINRKVPFIFWSVPYFKDGEYLYDIPNIYIPRNNDVFIILKEVI